MRRDELALPLNADDVLLSWMLLLEARFVSDARVLVEVVAPLLSPLDLSRPAVEQALNQTAHCEQVNRFALKLQSTCTSAVTSSDRCSVSTSQFCLACGQFKLKSTSITVN